jgi:hypothetical protein
MGRIMLSRDYNSRADRVDIAQPFDRKLWLCFSAAARISVLRAQTAKGSGDAALPSTVAGHPVVIASRD